MLFGVHSYDQRPFRRLSLRQGTLIVSYDPNLQTSEDMTNQVVPLEGATLTRAVDPLDGSVRIVVAYKTDEYGGRERLIIEPKGDDVESTITAFERQIKLAANIRNKFKPRL